MWSGHFNRTHINTQKRIQVAFAHHIDGHIDHTLLHINTYFCMISGRIVFLIILLVSSREYRCTICTVLMIFKIISAFAIFYRFL